MSVIERLPEVVYPLTQVNKVNEIVDILNTSLNTSYIEENPLLTPVNNVCTWTVTHNLATENVNCTIYEGDNLVISKVSVTSQNVVTVYLNSFSSIAAGTYRIVVMAQGSVGSSGGGGSYTLPVATTSTLGGVKIDGTSITINNGVISSSGGTPYTLPVATTSTLGGVKVDGTSITIDDGVISSAGGTVDSTLSSTSTNPVQNKVLYPALHNFIPAGNYYIKSNGTGDYTTLSGALSDLVNKWSDGEVILNIGNDTIIETGTNYSYYFYYPISIRVKGVSVSSSTIECSSTDSRNSVFEFRGKAFFTLDNIRFNRSNITSNSNYPIIRASDNMTVVLSGASFYGGNSSYRADGIWAYRGAKVIVNDIEFKYCNKALHSCCGDIVCSWGPRVTFIYCNIAMSVDIGGMIRLYSPSLTFDMVTDKTSQSVGTFTENGIITGFTL